MARFTLIPPFERFHGKVKQPDQDNGLVAFHNPKAGNVCRNWVMPDNPKSVQQTMIRGHFAAAAVAYKALSAVNAAAWRALAAQINKTNILGLGYALSGIACYQQVNVMRLLQGAAQSATAPAFADIPPPVTGVTSITMAGAVATTIIVTTGIANGCFILFRMTPAVSTFARLLRENELRIPSTTEADAFEVVAGSPTTNVITITQFAAPVATNYVGLEVTAMSAAYLARAPQFFNHQVVA